MQPVMSTALWAAVVVTLARRRKDQLSIFLLVMIVVMFVPFCLVQLGPPRAAFETDPQALWYWVDRTMLPAMLLTGYAGAAGVRGVRGDRRTFCA
jgi:hypothetical protein